MIAVKVVERPVDEVVDVITVRHGLVAAVRPVDVVGGMRAAGVGGRAVGRVGGRHGEHVLVDVRLVRVVQVPVVQVVRVAVVQDGREVRWQPNLLASTAVFKLSRG